MLKIQLIDGIKAHYIYQMYATISRQKYNWSTADNDTRLKPRNITTEIFTVWKLSLGLFSPVLVIGALMLQKNGSLTETG